jgi:hypothetical protein
MFNIYKYIEYNMYHMIYLFIKTIITYFIYFNGKILNLLSTIFMVFYYGLLNEQLQLFATGWVIMELINWMIYLFMYMKIIDPVLLCLNKQDINKIINRIDKLNKSEIEHIIKGSIIYDKQTHENINPTEFDIKNLSKKEIINLLGYSLFGISQDEIYQSPEIDKIYRLMIKIESILKYEFSSSNTNRYLYRTWGRDFINFNFRPLIFQIPIRLMMNFFHYYMIFIMKFKYKVSPKSKIGYLYKNRDLNKKDLIFIHGFGLGYIPYIRRLLKLDKQFNLVIMILPNISSYTYYDDIHCGYFPPHHLIKDSFYEFMDFIKVKNINILSHSFGTYITQIIRNDTRNNIINKIILVDPIIFWIGCFKMSLYIDKIAQKGTSVISWILEILTNYLIYKCLYLRYICYRVMFGPDFLIYDSTELEGKNIMLVLEYNDQVIPSDILYEKIKNKRISYYYLNDADHGSVLLSSKFDNIFENIITYY